MIPDLRWYDDLDPTGSDVADDAEALEQDCVHVILEDAQSNMADPDSGLGVANALSGVFDPSIGPLAEAQLAADQRVSGVAATVSNSGGTTTLDIQIEPDDDVIDASDTIEFSVPIAGGIS